MEAYLLPAYQAYRRLLELKKCCTTTTGTILIHVASIDLRIIRVRSLLVNQV